jgi:NAD(P)-dependent dehydrogenase (short-subunit alcohol dehydrogenase family)
MERACGSKRRIPPTGCRGRDREHFLERLKTAIENFGHFDILVNNSGIYEFASIENITEELWRYALIHLH